MFDLFAVSVVVTTLAFAKGLATYETNTLSCPNDKKCTFIENCQDVSDLMDRNLLPIHRFRQAICGYEHTKTKVCCDPNSNSMSRTFTGGDSRTFLSKSDGVPECGKSLIRSNIDTLGTYPFVARIGFSNTNGEVKYSCSGVIISERTVLTTASCALAKSERYKLSSVLVGEFSSETDPDCNSLFCGHKTRRHNISYIVKHPNYRADTFANDLALLRLEEPIQFSVTAQPICLVPKDKFVNVGSVASLVGWGKLASQKAKLGSQQSIKMKLLSRQDCAVYSDMGFAVELCAIGNEIPCSGYNGSPLLFKLGDTHYLLGLLSYGSNCDTRVNFPSVFVNSQKHTDWILENC